MIKIAICDDDNYISSEIGAIISEYEKICDVEIELKTFTTGIELINFIKSEYKFDLIFLDIELGADTGIEIGNIIRNKLDDNICKIVFITSKNGYEQQLFDIQPLNFIKKPLDREKVKKCISLAIKLLEIDSTPFEYKKKHEIMRVNIKDILYFESRRRQIKIVTNSGEDSFYETLENIKGKLPATFVAPHKSFFINFNKVERIARKTIFMKNGIEIPISQNNLENVRNMLISFEKEKMNVDIRDCLHYNQSNDNIFGTNSI